MLNDLLFRARAIFRRRRMEDDLADELRFHFEEQVALLERQGHDAAEARRLARLRFGGIEQTKDECRDARGVNFVENVGRDVRHAARGLMRSPGFTLVAVLSLAIGIGANTSIFAVVDAFLFRPPAFKDVDRLVALGDRTATRVGYPISYPNFLDWKARNHVFEAMAAYLNGNRVVGDDEGAERIWDLDVSDGFLRVVGVQPILGRDLVAGDHAAGAEAVALVSYELWQRRFAGDRQIVGKTITIEGRPFVVVGVLPPGFNMGTRPDAVTPIEQWGPGARRGSHNSMYAIARLRAGVTVAQAKQEMDAIAAALEREYPDTNKNLRVDFLPFGHPRMYETRKPLFMLLAAVGFVLLIACANISNLLLSRSATRARELAIRRAIGASRGRLMQQVLTESLVVAAFGGLVGLVVGEWGCRALVALAGDLSRIPGGEGIRGIHIDVRVFAFTLVVSAVAGVLSGLFPALHSSRGDLTPPLKEGGQTAGRSRDSRAFRNALVVVEVALALVLLTSAGLLIRTLHVIVNEEPGFDASHVLTFSLTRSVTRVPDDAAARAQLLARFEASTRRVVDELQTLPGVRAAAVAFPLPFGRGFSGDCYHVEGQPVPTAKTCPDTRVRQVSPAYAEVLGLQMTRGGWFSEGNDNFLATINETMAWQSWPAVDPVGRRFRLGTPPRFSPWYTVVGVVRNTKENGLDTDLVPEVYVKRYGGTSILVRTAGEPLSLLPSIRARVRSADPTRAMFDVFPLEFLIDRSVSDRRAMTWILGVFAGIALALAAIGIYGVVSYSVARRTQEMGVRVALGAGAANVLRLVLVQAMMPVVVGLLGGAAGSYMAGRALSGFLFGVTPADTVTFAAVAVLFAIVALAACIVPARRAMRVDPVVALRCE